MLTATESDIPLYYTDIGLEWHQLEQINFKYQFGEIKCTEKYKILPPPPKKKKKKKRKKANLC